MAPSCLLSSVEPVGGWFIPSTSSLCTPTSPHSQFGGPITLSSSHGCERYSTLRNHRAAPYTTPYAHRTNSPSKCPFPPLTVMHPKYTTSSPAINKKLKQMLLSQECFCIPLAFVREEPQSCKWLGFRQGCMGRRFTPLTVTLIRESHRFREEITFLIIKDVISYKLNHLTCAPS